MSKTEHACADPAESDQLPHLVRLLRRVTTAFSIFAIALLVFAQICQAGIVEVLRPFAPRVGGTSVLTATSLILIAVTLIFRNLPLRTVRRVNVLSCGIGLIALCSHVLWGDDVLSPRITAWIWGPGSEPGARTSVAAAIGIVLVSIAQIQRISGKAVFAGRCVGIALILASAAVLGFVYGAPDLHNVFFFSTISIYTALALVLLCVASVAADTQRGWAAVITSSLEGGAPTRRQIVLSLCPLVFAGLLLRLVHKGALSTEASVTFLMLLTVVPLLLLVIRDGKILNQHDKERTRSEKSREAAAIDMSDRLERQGKELAVQHQESLLSEAALYRAQRMDAIGQLTGGIAHDFNNLLMALTGNHYLLEQQVGPLANTKPYFAELAAITQRAARLSQQLLAFSRKQALDVRQVALCPILDDVEVLIRSAVGPHIDVKASSCDAAVWVETDAAQLQLAVLNLAINARDAMPNGGQLVLSTIENTNGTTGDTVTVRLRDNGVGMADAVAARAVEPFFSTKEPGKGIGLGLSQVYGFVTQCHGELRIDSQLGVGTTVDVILRRVASIQDLVDLSYRNEPSREQASPSGKMVLLVDDDDHVRAAMAELLRLSGFLVSEAANGHIALELLPSIQPSLVIIDYLMPGLNGAQVAHQAREIFPDLPIVFVSGYADTTALQSIPNALFFRKPVVPDVLVAEMQRVMSDGAVKIGQLGA